MTKLLLVDDHEVVRQGVKAVLSRQKDLEVIGEATDGREALEKIGSLRPHMVIMDIVMPNLNGIEANRLIKQQYPHVKVIMFTMYSSLEYLIPLFRDGISGLIFKGENLSELCSAIREVRRGGSYFSEGLEYLLSTGMGDRGKAMSDPFESLSRRQRDVFRLMAQGHSVRKVAALMRISPKTVETHKYQIMEKLKIASMPAWTTEAVRRKII